MEFSWLACLGYKTFVWSDLPTVFPQVKMEVAVPEEPQKKIFRARKTMKMSDRQQLETLHNTLAAATSSSASYPSSSSPPQTPLVNGTHTEKEKEKVKEKDLNHKEADLMPPAPDSAHCSPSASFTLSRSPSPPNKQTTSPTMDIDDPLVAAEEKRRQAIKVPPLLFLLPLLGCTAIQRWKKDFCAWAKRMKSKQTKMKRKTVLGRRWI